MCGAKNPPYRLQSAEISSQQQRNGYELLPSFNLGFIFYCFVFMLFTSDFLFTNHFDSHRTHTHTSSTYEMCMACESHKRNETIRSHHMRSNAVTNEIKTKTQWTARQVIYCQQIDRELCKMYIIFRVMSNFRFWYFSFSDCGGGCCCYRSHFLIGGFHSFKYMITCIGELWLSKVAVLCV